jgi:predicted short-subunit dehydrogenase-like oxidoreductase (DUF2520 family)
VLQIEDPCNPQDLAVLTTLEVEVGGEGMIAFEPAKTLYEVMLPEGAEAVVIRATAAKAEARVWYRLDDPCAIVEVGHTEAGGGEFTLESVPEGHSVLKVWAEAGIDMSQVYTVLFTQPMLCE